MTPDPRKVVAEFADSMATTSHRIGEHGDASAYETLAAQTLHPADILTMARRVGQAMAVRGYPEAGACVQLLAEIVDGDCPLHGERERPGIDLTDAEFEDYRAGAGLPPTPGVEPSGPPVDGREVDRYLPYDPLLSPESDEEAMHHGGLSGAMPVVDIADTPQTGGGAGVKGGAT